MQLAVDTMQPDAAVSLVARAVASGADWIELGRPLLDGVGFAGLAELTRPHPASTFVLDAMILAAPQRYMTRLGDLGIGAVTVTALAPDTTIERSVAAAREAGIISIVDLFNCADVRRAAAVAVGADVLMVHIGVDQRAADPGLDALDLVAELAAQSDVAIAYACYSPEEAVAARAAGATVLVFGEFWETLHPAELAELVATVRRP